MSQHVFSIMRDSDLRKAMGSQARAYFDKLRGCDHADTWKSIFDILCSDECSDCDWYAPEDLAPSEACVLPMLIDEIKAGYKNELENDMYYKFGRSLLKPVKVAYHGLKKMKRSIFG